jgi:hypothetical protein
MVEPLGDQYIDYAVAIEVGQGISLEAKLGVAAEEGQYIKRAIPISQGNLIPRQQVWFAVVVDIRCELRRKVD